MVDGVNAGRDVVAVDECFLNFVGVCNEAANDKIQICIGVYRVLHSADHNRHIGPVIALIDVDVVLPKLKFTEDIVANPCR
jgi:hypothetical protein